MKSMHRVLLVGLLAAAGSALSQDMGESIPASESPCNVSCGFDHSNPSECFQNRVVVQYWHRSLMGSVYPELDSLFADAPPDLCFCANVQVSQEGRIATVDVVRAYPEELGEKTRQVLLESRGAPIPPEAECIVGENLPISFGH